MRNRILNHGKLAMLCRVDGISFVAQISTLNKANRGYWITSQKRRNNSILYFFRRQKHYVYCQFTWLLLFQILLVVSEVSWALRQSKHPRGFVKLHGEVYP